MERTINIRLHDSIDQHNFRDPELLAAIGYMSMWGNADTVNIFIDKERNIDAHYIRKDTPKNDYGYQQPYFVMGGIRGSDDKYSFHS